MLPRYLQAQKLQNGSSRKEQIKSKLGYKLVYKWTQLVKTTRKEENQYL